MGRRYIYEASDNIDFIGGMGEEDFYENLSALSVDYVADMDPEDQKTLRESFAEQLKSHGATVKLITVDPPAEFPEGVLAVSHLNDTFKKNYFCDRYKEMKKLAESITLSQFAIDSSNFTLYKLKKSISDDYDDVVYLNGSYYNLDYFIRNADGKKTYYLGNVVRMH